MIGFLGSVRLTLVILAGIAGLSAWGTFAPHGNLYYHPVYLGILCLLALNILLCLLKRRTLLHGRFTLKKGGFLLTHSGILIILAGSWTSLVFGTRTLVWLGPGDSVDAIPTQRHEMENLGFRMTLQHFSTGLHASGIPDHYTSHAVVHEPGKPDRTVTIAVNHPFRKNAYRIFQSSYRLKAQQTVHVSVVFPDGQEHPVRIQVPGEPVVLNTETCESLLIKGLQYAPDFVMTGPHHVGTRSLMPRNPAVQVLLKCADDMPESGWLFLYSDPVPMIPGNRKWMVRLDAVDHQYETGLEFVRDPGVIVVLAGAFLLTAGVLLYLFTARTNGGSDK